MVLKGVSLVWSDHLVSEQHFLTVEAELKRFSPNKILPMQSVIWLCRC